MSRIRVYELAKEAGMSSKALTDKLIELGFEIKGHSSSVDDETAETIRNTILKSTNTELVEKRIDSDKDGPTVIRRRATVIRRKAKVVEDVPESPPEADSTVVTAEVEPQEVPSEPVVAEDESKEVSPLKTSSDTVAQQPVIAEVEAETAPSATALVKETDAAGEQKVVADPETETKEKQPTMATSSSSEEQTVASVEAAPAATLTTEATEAVAEAKGEAEQKNCSSTCKERKATCAAKADGQSNTHH
jgi:translation initiation factor IF-2